MLLDISWGRVGRDWVHFCELREGEVRCVTGIFSPPCDPVAPPPPPPEVLFCNAHVVVIYT